LALGNFLTSQKDAMANKYEEQLHQLEQTQDKLQRATEQYQRDKEQLDLDIAKYATKRQDLDKLIGRLDRSEK
jgi:chromosome segregation ATPase